MKTATIHIAGRYAVICIAVDPFSGDEMINERGQICLRRGASNAELGLRDCRTVIRS